jgi:deazaflavin-dependent oxidoreductase (nitroreductase family)
MSSTPIPYVQPGFVMAHLVNPIVARLGGTVVLTVRGRRSGKPITVPLGRPFVLNTVQYLVSGAGVTHWARNLRAVGQGELRLHGRRQPFRAVEIEPGTEHDRIVAAYRVAQGRTVATFFAQIPDPADHPVFRVEPIEAPQ